MLAISRQLLTRFWWNFKGRFLWTFRTDSNCQGDICPRDICPYQEYLSCNCSDFDQISNLGFWEPLEQIPSVTVTFVQAKFVHILNISFVTDQILTKCQRQGQVQDQGKAKRRQGQEKSRIGQGQIKAKTRSRPKYGQVQWLLTQFKLT